MEKIEFGNRYCDFEECLDDYREWYSANVDRVTGLVPCITFLRKACDAQAYLFHMLRRDVLMLRQKYTNTNELDKAIEEYTAWYARHATTISDVQPMLLFLKEALDNNLHLFHLMRNSINDALDTLDY